MNSSEAKEVKSNSAAERKNTPPPNLVAVKKEAFEFVENLRVKLDKILQENPALLKKIIESAENADLEFNEFGNLILRRIDLQPRDPDGIRDLHDYSLIEQSIGPEKVYQFVMRNIYELDLVYHQKVIAWVPRIDALLVVEKQYQEMDEIRREFEKACQEMKEITQKTVDLSRFTPIQHSRLWSANASIVQSVVRSYPIFSLSESQSSNDSTQKKDSKLKR